MCDETMEKQINLWICELITEFKGKKRAGWTAFVRLKAKENYSHVTQENGKFSASADYLIFQIVIW